MKAIIASVFLVIVWISYASNAFSQEKLPPQVVILQYHHVSSETPASTSLSPESFREHMQYIAQNHEVIRLKDAIKAIQENRPLPKNAISITFDDGYENILQNGHPILMEFGFPYTIFINPENIEKQGGQLSWEQVKQMQPLADFANHTLDHIHLLQRLSGESETQWLSRVMQNIEDAEQQLSQELGYSYRWLAYPFGEYNLVLQEALSEAGYLGFGQQSGAVAEFSQFTALPRFPAAGRYASLDTLKVKMASIAMPVIAHSPEGHQREVGEVMSSFSLQLSENASDVRKTQLACYFKGERIEPEIDGNVVKLSLEHSFTPGRIRINCTAPSKSEGGRFYWHSVAFFTPTKEGVFLD